MHPLVVSAKLIVWAPVFNPVPFKVQVWTVASDVPPVRVATMEPEVKASLLVIEILVVMLLM